MKLDLKKNLASKSLNVGKKRIIFDNERIPEIKEAITKQDIKDLKESGAIRIREVSGRRKVVKRKTRKRAGKIKLKVNKRKQDYVKLTRKLRAYIKELKNQGKIDLDKYKELRKKIRNSYFKSKRNLKESIEQ
jgi:large subunit ribosomal protein L19e